MIETEKNFKYRIRMSKSSESLPRSQVRSMLGEAIKQSGVNYALGKSGPKIALGPCSGEGEASISEYADICLKESIDVEELRLKLSPHISGGFSVEEINEIPYGLCSLESLCEYAAYIISPIDGAKFKAMDRCKAEIEIPHENGIREFKSVRRLIYDMKELGRDEVEIIIKLATLRSFGLERILTALLGLEGGVSGLKKLRRELYWLNAQGSLEPLRQEKN